mgnify:CR=1 FL=1
MKAIKKGADLVFTCDDGKTVKYNLNTGECIGKNGKPCKYLNSQLKGYTVGEIANSFEDKNFGRFINHVASKCSNNSQSIQNLGTVFQRMEEYKREEQIYSAGLTLSGVGLDYFKGTINEVPKGLAKILREIHVSVSNNNIKEYKAHPDAFNYAFNHEFISLNKVTTFGLLMAKSSEWDYATRKYNHTTFFDVCDKYGYTVKSLLNYLDYLATYEAITVKGEWYGVLNDIDDNCNMLSQMSNKYDRYPRHFLTSHRITSRTYERWKKEFDEELFAKRVNTKMETTIGDYKFIYPKTTKDIKDEAVQQSNCVASYIDRVINGQCDIILMRKKNDVENSLVTVEIRNGKVVQARQRFNESVNESEQKALDKYDEFLSKLNNKECA